MAKFYITTSIAYTNAPPHIGFALETIQADVLARYHRILGDDVFFLTGTDEHGAKIAKASEKSGKNPQEFTDEISVKFQELTKGLNLSNDDFIRTTDQARHWPTVKDVWLKLKENNDIYKKNYKGLYCVGCEAFITQKDLIDGKCKIHLKEPEAINEENYFFRLSKYSNNIKELIEKGEVKIIPQEKKNEMLSFIKASLPAGRQGLEDVSFSRPSKDLKWGIPVPDDDSQTIYVWADALVNYLLPKKYWPADIHCLGKDILRFHATIWLGMLLSLKLSLPKSIFVHGFITSNGQKMSKSLGNVVDPFELIEKYGADAVRYFLLREIPSTEDGDFTIEKFEQRYNSDLASGLGNLVARVIAMARDGHIPDKFSVDPRFKIISDVKDRYKKALGDFKFNEALIAIWELISFCDKVVNEEKPWEGEKEKVISDLLLTIGEIAELLRPFLPETSEKILEQLKLKKSQPLFPRLG